MDFTPRCPTCRALVQWQGNEHRPFCSERCRLADLGAWVTGQYQIPGDPTDDDPPDDGDSSDGDST